MAWETRVQTPNRQGGSEESFSGLVTAPGPMVQDADNIQLNLSSTNASATVNFEGRMLTLAGNVVPWKEAVVITVVGNQTAKVTVLTSGWIIGFNVYVSVGTVLDGQIKTSVEITRGSGASITRVMSLAAGDITNTRSLGLGGFTSPSGVGTAATPTVVTVAPADPAAGAEFSLTVTAGQVWEIQAVKLFFTTAVAAATREVSLIFDDGVNILFRQVAAVSQIASLGYSYNCSQFGAYYSPVVTNTYLVPISRPILAGGSRIRTFTTGLQGADQYSTNTVSYRQY